MAVHAVFIYNINKIMMLSSEAEMVNEINRSAGLHRIVSYQGQ